MLLFCILTLKKITHHVFSCHLRARSACYNVCAQYAYDIVWHAHDIINHKSENNSSFSVFAYEKFPFLAAAFAFQFERSTAQSLRRHVSMNSDATDICCCFRYCGSSSRLFTSVSVSVYATSRKFLTFALNQAHSCMLDCGASGF